jgi:hypothetical protein
MTIKLTPINHNPDKGNNATLIVGGGIMLMIAIGLPQLGWSPVLYGLSAMAFAVALLSK